MKALQYGTTWLLMAALSGCGYQLSGVSSHTGLKQPVSLMVDFNNITLQRQFRAQLQGHAFSLGTKEYPRIHLLKERYHSLPTGVSASTNTRQYTLSYAVSYLVETSAKSTSTPHWARAQRTLVTSSNTILATSEESIILRQEMQQDVVQQIITQTAVKLANKS